MITVFTPTYNRAELLPRLFDSLKHQIFKDFEWLIVDDGSTDNTMQLVNQWIQKSPFKIRYIYQDNGGKHRAINRGVREAAGELFFIVDSDDILPEKALYLLWNKYIEIKYDERFAGICGLRSFTDGTIVQDEVPYEILDCSYIDMAWKYKIRGDKAEALKTNIMMQYPFPEFEGENFCAESAVWNAIGSNYLFRYFNEVVYKCEYLGDGLSANSIRNRMKNPLGAMYIYGNLCKYDIPFIARVRASVNYWRFFFCGHKNNKTSLPFIFYPMIIFGFFCHIHDYFTRGIRQRLNSSTTKRKCR